MSDLRDLPSVDQLLQRTQVHTWIGSYGRPLVVEALRFTLEEIRASHQPGKGVPDPAAILGRTRRLLEAWTASSLRPVINATGVILHTNLGRAPLSRAAQEAVSEAARGYTNLEYDLGKGQRGSRLLHAEALLIQLLGVEAAVVVNNNAAAVLLALSALAKRQRVIIARSQLVEIGGGFRVPDVMKQSGAKLVEVGTTNRVHLADYTQALSEGAPGLVMRAHRSNFQIVGFTSEPSLEEICQAAHAAGAIVVDDLGSGALVDTARYGLAHEPTVQESLAAGADLVCFSGDKLLGGPQAGIVVGKAALVEQLRKHPLMRAVRADKLCLAALSATLLHYLKDEADKEIPVLRMLALSTAELRHRLEVWAAVLPVEVKASALSGKSTIGGGSLPGETLPSWLLALEVPRPNRFLARLRELVPPIIARLENDLVVFDPRTVLPEEEGLFLSGLKTILAEMPAE